MARRIFIHAGQHKTGTTSFQHYIERHRDVLAEHGVTAWRDWTPDLAGEARGPLPCNARMIANALVRPSLLTPMRLSGAARPLDDASWRARLPALRAAIAADPSDTVLLSAEAFAFLREPAERRRLDELCDGFTAEAVMILRRPESFLASWRVQAEHAGYAAMPGARAGEGILDLAPGSWLTDHAAMRRFWGGRCRFLAYEEVMARHGSVIPALLEAIGLEPARCPAADDLFLNSGAKKRQEIAGRPT